MCVAVFSSRVCVALYWDVHNDVPVWIARVFGGSALVLTNVVMIPQIYRTYLAKVLVVVFAVSFVCFLFVCLLLLLFLCCLCAHTHIQSPGAVSIVSLVMQAPGTVAFAYFQVCFLFVCLCVLFACFAVVALCCLVCCCLSVVCRRLLNVNRHTHICLLLRLLCKW